MSFGSGSPHTGPSTTGTVDQAPVADTTAGHFSFKTAARPCLVSNGTGTGVYGFTNKTGTPTITDNHWFILDGEFRDISEGGAINVSSLSVWVVVGGDVDKLQVKGWLN